MECPNGLLLNLVVTIGVKVNNCTNYISMHAHICLYIWILQETFCYT